MQPMLSVISKFFQGLAENQQTNSLVMERLNSKSKNRKKPKLEPQLGDFTIGECHVDERIWQRPKD